MDQHPENLPSRRSKMNQVPDQEILQDFIRTIIEVAHQEHEEEQDPFEEYARQLRMRFQDPRTCVESFMQGYQVLLKQLSSAN